MPFFSLTKNLKKFFLADPALLISLFVLLTFNGVADGSYAEGAYAKGAYADAPESGLATWSVSFEKQDNTKVGPTLKCEAAVKSPEKSRGLMFRTSLPENGCMIFYYASPQILRFWMRNTLIPLSIAYVASQGGALVIVDIFDMEPLDETSIVSTAPAQYAIEVNQGWFQKNGVQPGDIVHIIKGDK